jgi:hypothetical protein
MTQGDPFDLRPDPVLGARLRSCLDLGDDTRFVEGVLARLAEPPRPLEILAAWARPGVAAALLIASALGYWVARQSLDPVGAEPSAEIAAADRTLDRDALMVVALDDTP